MPRGCTPGTSTRAIQSLVVGGTRGLGRAVVKALAAEGHLISVIGRRLPVEADQQIPGVRHWVVDVTDGTRLFETLAEIGQILRGGAWAEADSCQWRLTVDGGLSLRWHESLARELTSLNTVEVVRRNHNDVS
jgi:hypothetical protein